MSKEENNYNEEDAQKRGELVETREFLKERVRFLERTILLQHREAGIISRKGPLNRLASEVERTKEELENTRYALEVVEKILAGKLESPGQRRAEELTLEMKALQDAERYWQEEVLRRQEVGLENVADTDIFPVAEA
ncbi:MAG TPA: hypothetical protein VJK09_00520 [Candidatus Paceibacterota bacterium]